MSQRRVGRACDQCNFSRTRCDGDLPWYDYLGHRCQYNRQVKKRGRKTNLARRSIGSRSLSDRYRSVQESPSPIESRISSRHSTTNQDDIQASLQLAPLHCLGLEQPNLTTDSSNGINFEQIQTNSPLVPDSSHFPLGLGHSSHLSPMDPLLVSTFPASPSESTSEKSPARNSTCRYPCLKPLLPALKNILCPEIACDLLDIFFSEPGSSLCFAHSPYILSPVLRKKSVLHPSKPRPTSPALLATMLWCVAHTADFRIFYVPGSRQRIVNELYGVAMSFLRRRDMDNWRRVPGGWQLEEDSTTSLDTEASDRAPRTFSTGPKPCVDDVLTFALLTIVISGGEYKSDCVKWWNKTVGLVKYLGLHKEPSMPGNTPNYDKSQASAEEHEEQRRAFWLVYAVDRHLALSHNRSLHILDAECEVLTPLPEHSWQSFGTQGVEALQQRSYGPPTTISGAGFFEYFLPMMAILGDIIDFRLRRYHPRLVSHDDTSLEVLKASLTHCERSLRDFAGASNPSRSPPNTTVPKDTANMVVAYAVYILKVLYVLLYGKWDAITMLEDDGDWITSSRFADCSSSSIAAARAISDILTVDPELSFMPYLFGIYLFHGSFVLLLFAERMSQIGPNPSVEEACEVIIRAHEVAIVTLSTEFQKTFRKAFRSILYNARRPEMSKTELQTLRKEVLSMYRWTMGRPGLCL
ncbi:fungal specific transcription factor domain-containing protein [Aspergillus foveolatus]|uniref:fungal specific transcription factor domain-containing protein n=1 Tax=Aspergillus foveolatus TaxID=210207 RepID=UPI003CCE2046